MFSLIESESSMFAYEQTLSLCKFFSFYDDSLCRRGVIVLCNAAGNALGQILKHELILFDPPLKMSQ